MKKTDRKNKTGLTVNWPKNLFTIEDCHTANPDFVNITLRVRIKNAIREAIVNELGYLPNGKGRPRIVMVHGPITQEHIADAKSKGVLLKSALSINVMNIQTPEVESVAVPNIATVLSKPTSVTV